MLLRKTISMTEDELKEVIGKHIVEKLKEDCGAHRDIKIKFGNGTTTEELCFDTIKFTWNETLE